MTLPAQQAQLLQEVASRDAAVPQPAAQLESRLKAREPQVFPLREQPPQAAQAAGALGLQEQKSWARREAALVLPLAAQPLVSPRLPEELPGAHSEALPLLSVA